MKFLLVFSLLVSATLQSDDISKGPRPRHCRCQPHQSCWPSDAEWARFNSSIDGNLVAVTPLAYPCHWPHYNSEECTSIKQNTANSTYRSDIPAALQGQNWEAWPAKHERCYVETPQSEPCGQGRVSLYSVVVQSAQHIQAAVNFARKHNLRLAIKNTGHDFLGRSSAPYSLQILTHLLKNIAVIDNFVPHVGPGTAAPPPVKAVTLGAGVQLHEMYEYLGSQGVMVVGGMANTVGVSGGYIQGGGHSFMGWLHGMASDNALEFEVALADVNLFFALRGGGGGTFGIVVSVTVNAFPDYPVILTHTSYTIPTPDGQYWAGVEAMQRHVLRLNDHGGAGSYRLLPLAQLSPTQNASLFLLELTFVNQTDVGLIRETLFPPLISDMQESMGITPSFEATPFPSMSSMYATIFTGNDTGGYIARLGTRLISRSFVSEPDSPKRITTALAGLEPRLNDFYQGLIVAGGQVAANKDRVNSALHPAWRETALHLGVFRRLDPSTVTFADEAQLAARITQEEVPVLKSFEPGEMGAYVNEADADEVDFQESFWGPNYPSLYEIKKRRDPWGLFIVRKGIGSEEWDGDGLCRV